MSQGESDLVKQLRDQVARLISDKLELQRQLEDLRRTKADAPISNLASGAAQSVRLAEQAMAEESDPQAHYIISEMEASFQGVVVSQAEELALRLPLPEYGVDPGHLGYIRMTLAHIPITPQPAQPSGVDQLAAGLENVQAAFLRWERRGGARAAQQVVDQITQLLAARSTWQAPDILQNLTRLAETAQQAVKAAGASLAPAQAAAARLGESLQDPSAAGRLTEADLLQIAGALEELVSQLP
jgi:hypothetical protein